MIHQLKAIEKSQILEILHKPIEEFRTLYIDYEKPYVERLQYKLENGNLLSFHLIHECEAHEALYHPHAWPSAMHVLKGEYEMGISYSENDSMYDQNNADGRYNKILQNDELCKILVSDGFYYEMPNRKAWHYVRPTKGPVMSTMLMGEKWYSGSKPTKELYPLPTEKALVLQTLFTEWYKNHQIYL